MSDRPDPPADKSTPPAFKWRRRRLPMAMLALTASVFMWPAVLQYERSPAHLESVRVQGPAEAPAGQAGKHGPRTGVRHDRGVRRLAGSPGPGGDLGALHEDLPSVLAAQLLPATPAKLPSDDLVQAIDFAMEPSPGAPAAPFTLPAPGPLEPELGGFVGGPGPGAPGATPPVTIPPVVEPATPGPLVVVPPVVTPPGGNPPVVQPPISPPVTNPTPPPIEPTGPGGGPGSPGGQGGPGGTPSGVPEPSAWIEFVLGAGLAGAAIRAQRRQPLAALRASSRA